MNIKDLKIVVSGDICINTLHWVTNPPNTEGVNWQTHNYLHRLSKPGGALLLAELIKQATGIPVISPELSDVEAHSTTTILRSTAELDLFPYSSDEPHGNTVLRVRNYLGFTGLTGGRSALLAVEKDDVDADFVIIDDENNGFNNNKRFWPLALRNSEKKPTVLYKMNNPIGASDLWQHLDRYHIDSTIVVINGEDMRSKGVNISKSISWERTALDFTWQLSNNPNLSFLAHCRHLIVPFGLEGVIYYKNDGVPESRLYFLPYEFEGGFVKESLGKMYGLTSCFVAGLAKSITGGAEDISVLIDEGIREGMVAAKKYFVEGFGEDADRYVFPNASIFEQNRDDIILKDHVQDVKIYDLINKDCQEQWYILKEKSSANLAEIAYDIVKNGEEKALKYIPTARFGQLKTVDRTEIESYRSIKNLITEYVVSRNYVRPLSIAVFGTPGSGKSFGVTEVASSIAPELIRKLNFNLSQFRSPNDLVKAFHRARDLTLEGRLPLIIFDEFDSSFEGKLGWLKYFLAPMQDGVFREEDSVHPIGKAIFVFAGGTSSSFNEFCGEKLDDDDERKLFFKEFRSAKGPDFVSRLRGYVDILGPNPTSNKADQLFIIRRAMLLRSLIDRKAPHLVNEKGEAQIDNGVLRALLKVPKFKHEARSMEAIMEMSMLNKAKKWEQSHLPSSDQLRLHVDEDQFLRHMMHDAFFSEKIDALAANLRNKFLLLPESELEMVDSSSTSWEDAEAEIKEFYRSQVKRIPDALLKIQYDVIYVNEKPEVIMFSEAEVEELAQYEYKRRFSHKKDVGWKYGDILDLSAKTDPDMVPWLFLRVEKKKQVYNMIGLWTGILADSSFRIERLKFISECDIE